MSQSNDSKNFSPITRALAVQRLGEETFDLLIIGGGITGAATARDAQSRGLKVALVEARDFAWGTSSRSSKLVHGGLRYLEHLEFGLVFEALSERARLLKVAPHLVRPLKFFLPMYADRSHDRSVLISMGLWLYDALSLFRAHGVHKRLSKKKLLGKIPTLNPEGLKCGFEYFDASMWDDSLCLDNLRSASELGAVVVNYVEAEDPHWNRDRIDGFLVRDKENPQRDLIRVRAHQVVSCTGPWTDELGGRIKKDWTPWLSPSKGIHLVFDLNRLPIPGALVMSHPDDGRIAFVIARPDFGPGVAIVGTTDGPTPAAPEQTTIDKEDVDYLMGLLRDYFPALKLQYEDIISAYVGVRPLMGAQSGAEDQSVKVSEGALQNVSREHYIGLGPGGIVMVAGGKYTTHRTMAEEIVDFVLRQWERCSGQDRGLTPPRNSRRPRTKEGMNPAVHPRAVQMTRSQAQRDGITLPEKLLDRYGAEALIIARIHEQGLKKSPIYRIKDPEGFPYLAAQLHYAIAHQMVLHLEDFYFRRVPLYLSRRDHGLPWAEELSRIWAYETGATEGQRIKELAALEDEIERRSAWFDRLTGVAHQARSVTSC